MSTHNTKTPNDSGLDRTDPGNVGNPGRKGLPAPPEEPDRLRDIIVVIVTYPLTPNEKTNKLAEKKPWLEFISLLLKVLLALYALWEAVG
ncbi:hypothetical protein [Neolewinella litorea]|uniref:Uncharacterized protein n=1 Tax=Neolewinella litorea TaxID=2562452 RepID=A0A4S4N870_9BACT|nr:hypothetical protein [Neolewinella litorea]THH34537.1 hypothetical protein E4021_17575 [Neolewinella litorea]